MTAPLLEPARGVAHDNARAAAMVAAALPGHVVLSPGSRSTPLALAFDQSRDARVHVVLDERAAGFVALGIGRATGMPATLVCTSGSAGAHYLPAVIEARYARVPLMVLTADRPAELQACGAPQTVSQARLFGEHVRFQMELPVPDGSIDARWLRNALAQARARTLGSPPGPVHVNVPFREPLWEPGVHAETHLEAATVRFGRRALAAHDIAALAAELRAHPRGVIACGPLAPATTDARALADAVCALAKALGWPVLADAASGVRFGAHECIIGCAEAIVRYAPLAEALAPTLVLRMGMLPTSKTLAAWLASHGRSVLIDPDGEWHDPAGAAKELVIADAADLCRTLAGAMDPLSDRRWLERWQHARARAGAALASACGDGGWEGAVARAVVDALPEGAQLHLGSSMPIRDVDAFAPALDRHVVVHANRGCNGIDGTVSTALGEALAYPGPTVALLGDLTFLHDLDGLATVAEMRAPLVMVVVHNDGGGIFRFLPIASYSGKFERLFATPQSADLGALCTALGIAHQRIDAEPRAISAAVATAIDRGAPMVIEVRVDPHSNVARHEQAWARAARALERGERSTS